MADVQKENGFTPIANDLLEAIYESKFSGMKLSIILVIMRNTYGWNRKSHDMGLTYIANAVNGSKSKVKQSLDELIGQKVILVEDTHTASSSRVLMINKDYETWLAVPRKGSTPNRIQYPKEDTGSTLNSVQGGVPNGIQGSTPNGIPTKKDKENSKENIYTIFDHWNSKKIMVHRELNQKRKSAINARLAKYSIDQLVAAINNYDLVIRSDDYFFSYKWSLEDFMNPKNLDRFLDENEPLKNFAKDKKVKNIHDHKKQKEIDRFNFDMQLGRWVDAGNDPSKFVYRPGL